MKIWLFSFILSLSTVAKDLIDFSPFNLTESQLKLVQRMEARNKYTRQFLIDFAKRFEVMNQREARHVEYIPPHTPELLNSVVSWAAAGALSPFAEKAGYKFLKDLYMSECPSLELFNFGRATGTEFLQIDVLKNYFNTFQDLQHSYSHNQDNLQVFKERFLRLAKDLKVEHLIEPL